MEFCIINGRVISSRALKIRRSQETVTAIKNSPYCKLVNCKLDDDGNEWVIFDIEVTRGQVVVHDINRTERIAAGFDPKNEMLPEVLALRDDFPQVPHLNLRTQKVSRCLCLYEESHDEVKTFWTGPDFINRICNWLDRTARGELHADDQPLEPLLPSTDTLVVIPSGLFADGDRQPLLVLENAIEEDALMTLVLKKVESEIPKEGINWVAAAIQTQPQPHGIIHTIPKNLKELSEFLKSGNIDLLAELKQQFKQWASLDNKEPILSANLILLVILPKTRSGNDAVEAIEFRVFLIHKSIKFLGTFLDFWGIHQDELAIIMNPDPSKDGSDIPIKIANIVFDFSRADARLYSNVEGEYNQKILAVGLGAIGSQVFLNLVRMGVGRWVLVDDDVLMPHNLARHALLKIFIGHNKAKSLACVSNHLLGSVVAKPVAQNILRKPKNEQVAQILEGEFTKADIILDMSASVPVARHLHHDVKSEARRISLFLNPSGTDLVMIAEDNKRQVTLDLLEMQYYRFICNEVLLEKHLWRDGKRLRYAQSCRDVSSTLPQDLMALHSGIGSRAFRNVLDRENASIQIWHTDVDEITVHKLSCSIADIEQHQFGEWTLYTDAQFLKTVFDTRAKKLPNETGGVLIGAIDYHRKIIYVIDTILSPPDSMEWPILYIRGCQGLEIRLKDIQRKTDHMLMYLGEWHSHPDRHNCRPSQDDHRAFLDLKDMVAEWGMPPLMLIIGDQDQYEFYLNEME